MDKAIFKTSFTPPLYKGVVVRYKSEQNRGIIKESQGEEVSFQTKINFLQIGNLVTFNKYPCIYKPEHFYATNISKGFLSKDGCLVVDHLRSHVHGDLKQKLSTIIKEISCSNRNYIHGIFQFPNIVGQSNCVPITWEDEIVYAKRLGRQTYSKFVKNRESIPTNQISIFLKRHLDIYIIMSCYYGDFHIDAISSDFESIVDERLSFWDDHALIFRTAQIDPATITTRCPWTGVNEYNLLGSIYRDKSSFQQYFH